MRKSINLIQLNTIKLQKIVGNLLYKIIHEQNGHLEIFRRPELTENCRQYLHLRTDILQSLGAPV